MTRNRTIASQRSVSCVHAHPATVRGMSRGTVLGELEPQAEWRAADVADPEAWTLRTDAADQAEIEGVLATAKAKSTDPLELGRRDFPFDRLAAKLHALSDVLLNGRGFARIAGLDTGRHSDEDLTLLYWGIGLHLGEPRAQNKHGHVLGDVTDQGKTMDDATARGYEFGQVRLDYHSDGSDLVGLLCLRTARSGGLSCVANAVAIHNHLVRERPDLAAVLYEPLPIDARGEEADGAPPFYLVPCFNRRRGRLFVRFNPLYVLASQRHPDAPRLTATQHEAITAVAALAADPDFNVYMDLQPGEMQFINNYHVLHGRTAYEDDPAGGHKRHLKRLWLVAHGLTGRPIYFAAPCRPGHWEAQRSVSAQPMVERVAASA